MSNPLASEYCAPARFLYIMFVFVIEIYDFIKFT